MPKRIEYHIFKRLYGIKFPGELWHECGSITKARRIFKRDYQDEPGATGDEKNVFHIIKVTYETVPEQNRSARRDKTL